MAQQRGVNKERFGRRAGSALKLALAFMLLLNAISATETPKVPQVKGPIPSRSESQMLGAEDVPGGPPRVDFAGNGYVEEECFISGAANLYRYDDKWNRVLKQPDIPYTTRMILRRPTDHSKFSGNIQFECSHRLFGGTLAWSAAGAPPRG